MSGAALLVVVGAVIAAIVAVGSIPTPSYTLDAPLASSLVPSARDLPGWRSVGRALFRPSQVAGDASLTPSAQVLRQDRGCAFLDGPTDPRQLTAVAADAFGAGTAARGAELFAEAITYRSAAPVEADLAAARRPGMDACVARLLAASAGADRVRSAARLKPVGLGGGMGDVVVVALAGTWSTFIGTPGGSQVGGVHIELVLVTRSRAEVVTVVENPTGPVPQALVDRLARRSAQALQSQLA